MKSFKKILIANRGEIAIRIMRAANEMGKRTVAIYAEEDKLGLHRFKADEAYRIGKGMGPVAAYLSIPEIIRVAKMCGADAIHPGYGLLSENPDFVDACEEAGIKFIGPKAETMRKLGDKASARRVAMEAGVPVVPATDVLPDDMNKVRQMAEEVGYPFMLKASWGGGGRGMRPIMDASELEEKVLEGRREAEAAFGNGEGYLERLVERARHVEVQILVIALVRFIIYMSVIVLFKDAIRKLSNEPLHHISQKNNDQKSVVYGVKFALTLAMNVPALLSFSWIWILKNFSLLR